MTGQQQTRGTLRRRIVAVVIALAVVLAAAFLGLLKLSEVLLAPIVKNPNATLGPADLSTSGQFYSLAYGLPVAMIGAFVGALATMIAGYLAARYGDIDILEFAEKRIVPSILHQQRLADGLAAFLKLGGHAQDLAIAIATAAAERSDAARVMEVVMKPGKARNLKMLANSADTPQQAPDTDPVYEAFTEMSDIFIKALLDSDDKLREAFQAVREDLYSSLFCAQQLGQADKTNSPLLALKAMVPSLAEAQPYWFGHSLLELSGSIDRLSVRTQPEEILEALIHLPQKADALDFIGAILFSPSFEAPRDGNPLIAGYRFNFGAAYLAAIWRCLPEKEAISLKLKEIFRSSGSIFGARLRTLETFVETSVQGRDVLLTRPQICLFEARTLKPERLIIVDEIVNLHDGSHRRPTFYDPVRHGPLPDSWLAA